MRFFLHSLGCRLNEAELEDWARQLQGLGHQLAKDAEDADVMILNTCAVTAEAARKSRQMARRLRRHNPKARTVMTGCLATLAPPDAANELGVDLILPNSDKARLVELAMDHFGLPPTPVSAMEPGAETLFARGRQRAFVKIQDGCRYHCTFCIVTVARGEERSLSVREIISQINLLIENGVQEVVLTGVHVGGYGSDMDSDLHQLIAQILQQTDIPRLRLASVEPWDIPKNFFELYASNRLMPHLHLALQSGSDSVLQRMARRCKTDCFRDLVRTARETRNDFNITTDIIVGFPGESDDEWKQTLDFIKEIGFGDVHIFPYSARHGTAATRLPGRIPREITRQRTEQLHALASDLKINALQRQVGRQVPVLWEKRRDDGTDVGYTPSFFRVLRNKPDQPSLENRITDTHLRGVSPDGANLLGEAK
ncbi:MAG: tRNA (N(6)-L-threonylcarbamoyladenosine(37)-C(2))-methylthiotransferase MtaB [Chromatiales bacterium]|nr:tRNA (N(6)-L-threonylcarbamoyladenosine(37)-C(2))-methylthiotransferase MtaB [Chromatiales bacterium]